MPQLINNLFYIFCFDYSCYWFSLSLIFLQLVLWEFQICAYVHRLLLEFAKRIYIKIHIALCIYTLSLYSDQQSLCIMQPSGLAHSAHSFVLCILQHLRRGLSEVTFTSISLAAFEWITWISWIHQNALLNISTTLSEYIRLIIWSANHACIPDHHYITWSSSRNYLKHFT